MKDTLLRKISLEGKAAIVTGAGRGIGRGVAKALGDASASLLLTDIDEASLQESVAMLREDGVTAHGLVVDSQASGAGEQVVAKAVELFGGLDVLVNNAAVFLPAPVLDVTEGEWDRMVDLNLKGMFFHAQAAAKAMVGSGRGGRIINVASVAAYQPNELLSVYAATKGGVISATRAIAKELGDRNVLVNAVLPGAINTPGAGIAIGKITELSSSPPTSGGKPPFVLGRMGSAEDIGDAVLFFASGLSNYVTGTTLVVDGGYLI